MRDYHLTTIQIYYYIPNYQSILNEFIWQSMDLVPGYPRMQRFLIYWKDNIDATIQTINISHIEEANVVYAKCLYEL